MDSDDNNNDNDNDNDNNNNNDDDLFPLIDDDISLGHGHGFGSTMFGIGARGAGSRLRGGPPPPSMLETPRSAGLASTRQHASQRQRQMQQTHCVQQQMQTHSAQNRQQMWQWQPARWARRSRQRQRTAAAAAAQQETRPRDGLKEMLRAYADGTDNVGNGDSADFDDIPLVLSFRDASSAAKCRSELRDNKRLARCAIERWMRGFCDLCKVYSERGEIRTDAETKLPSLVVDVAFVLSPKALKQTQQQTRQPWYVPSDIRAKMCAFRGGFYKQLLSREGAKSDASMSAVVEMLKSLRTVLQYVFDGLVDVSFGSLAGMPHAVGNWVPCVSHARWGDIAYGDVQRLTGGYLREEELQQGVCLFAKGCRRALRYARASPDDFAPVTCLFAITLFSDILAFIDRPCDDGQQRQQSGGCSQTQQTEQQTVGDVQRVRRRQQQNDDVFPDDNNDNDDNNNNNNNNDDMDDEQQTHGGAQQTEQQKQQQVTHDVQQTHCVQQMMQYLQTEQQHVRQTRRMQQPRETAEKLKLLADLVSTVERDSSGLAFDTSFHVYVDDGGNRIPAVCRRVYMRCSLLCPRDAKKFVAVTKYVPGVAEVHAYHVKRALLDSYSDCVSYVVPEKKFRVHDWVDSRFDDPTPRGQWVDVRELICGSTAA